MTRKTKFCVYCSYDMLELWLDGFINQQTKVGGEATLHTVFLNIYIYIYICVFL